MSIEAELKKEGIEVTEELDAITIKRIAQNVSSRICSMFYKYGINENDLFNRISNLKMYKARRPERNE